MRFPTLIDIRVSSTFAFNVPFSLNLAGFSFFSFVGEFSNKRFLDKFPSPLYIVRVMGFIRDGNFCDFLREEESIEFILVVKIDQL